MRAPISFRSSSRSPSRQRCRENLGNTNRRSLRRLSSVRLGDFFGRLREKTTFGAAQALQPAARDFFEQRIDFGLDEFGRTHALNAPGRFTPPAQRAP